MSKKVKREYSDDELIRRVTDIEEIKKVANKRVYYQDQRVAGPGARDLWVTVRRTRTPPPSAATPASMWGMDAIRGYYVTARRRSGDGVGMNAHPISTGLVELAGDGKTAKGLWYSIGQDTVPTATAPPKPCGSPARWPWTLSRRATPGRSGIVEANDLVGEAGTRYGDEPVYLDYSTDPVAVEFGTPTVGGSPTTPPSTGGTTTPPCPSPMTPGATASAMAPRAIPPTKTDTTSAPR